MLTHNCQPHGFACGSVLWVQAVVFFVRTCNIVCPTTPFEHCDICFMVQTFRSNLSLSSHIFFHVNNDVRQTGFDFLGGGVVGQPLHFRSLRHACHRHQCPAFICLPQSSLVNFVVGNNFSWNMFPNVVRLRKHSFKNEICNVYRFLTSLARDHFAQFLFSANRRISKLKFFVCVLTPTGTASVDSAEVCGSRPLASILPIPGTVSGTWTFLA